MLFFWRALLVDGGWWVLEFGKGRRVVRLGTWEKWECGEVGKVGREQRGRMELPLELHLPFWRIVVRKFLWWGDHQRKKLFINSSVEALISFKGKHQDLYWKWMYLWGGSGWFECGKKRVYLQKRRCFWNRKQFCEEASWNLLKSCLSFAGGLDVLIKKMERGNKKRDSIVKHREMLFEGGLWRSCGTLHLWRSYGNCFYQEMCPSWYVRLVGWDRVAYWL